MRGECRASGDGSLYAVPSCELSGVKTKIMLNIGCCSAQLRCGAAGRRSRVLSKSRLSLSLFRFFRLTRVAARSRGAEVAPASTGRESITRPAHDPAAVCVLCPSREQSGCSTSLRALYTSRPCSATPGVPGAWVTTVYPVPTLSRHSSDVSRAVREPQGTQPQVTSDARNAGSALTLARLSPQHTTRARARAASTGLLTVLMSVNDARA
jgi:hypothetical protein